MRLILTSVALLGFCAAPVLGQVHHIRALLPITVEQQVGRFDSRWQTEITALHEVSELVVFGFDYRTDCPGPCGLPPIPIQGVPAPFDFYETEPGTPPGVLLHVAASKRDAVHITSRLKELSNGTSVQVPVVWEDDLREAPQYFLDVPYLFARRLTLRIYSLEVERESANAEVRVVLRDREGNVAMNSVFTLRLSAKQRVTNYGSVPIRPLAAEFPLVPQTLNVQTEGALTVTIYPSDGAMLWSFISDTSNEDQDTSLIFPQ